MADFRVGSSSLITIQTISISTPKYSVSHGNQVFPWDLVIPAFNVIRNFSCSFSQDLKAPDYGIDGFLVMGKIMKRHIGGELFDLINSSREIDYVIRKTATGHI